MHHIDGVQLSMLSQKNDLTVTIQAIQVHNVPGHWVTSSSIGGNLAVYIIASLQMVHLYRSYQLASIYGLLAERDENGDVRCLKLTVI